MPARQQAAALGLLALATQLRVALGSCEFVEGNCICTSAAGVEWDLTALQSNNIQTTGDTQPGCSLCTGDWTYTFAICGNAAQQTGTGCISTAQRNAFRVDQSTLERCEYMGQDAETGVPLTVTDLTDGVDGVSIQYTDTIRTMTLNIRCETPYGTAPEPLGPGSGSNDVVLTWYSGEVCLGGGGNGWLIVILMSVAAGIYVGGGIGYVKRQQPDAPLSLEIHPHIHHWREVPGLVSDGIYFSRVKLATNVEFLAFLAPKDQPGGGYSDIDDGRAGGSGEKQLLKSDMGEQESKTSKPRPTAKPNPKKVVAASSEDDSSGSDESSSDDEGDKKDPVE
eukprot:COSAG02_NODE_14442_length_1271_cov_65.087884_1_plen_337_part_00